MLIAEYDADPPVLKETLERVPDLRIRSEELYSSNGDIDFLFWAECSDWDRFEATLGDDPTVTNPKLLAETADARLYQVQFTGRGASGTTYRHWSDFGIVLLEATATGDGWELRMRVPDRDALARYRAALRERDIDFRLTALYSKEAERRGATITEKQRETLLAAYESGYFEIPRAIGQPELAEQLGIASQSLSERLRRGTSALVETTLY